MPVRKVYLTAGATLGCAVAIGFLVQNGSSVDPRSGEADDIASDMLPPEDIAVTDIVLTSSSVPLFDPVAVFSDLPALPHLPAATPAPSVSQTVTRTRRPVCDVALSASASDAAMVDLSVSAPCFANQMVTVGHAGLEFSARTGRDGTLNLAVPALAADATFSLVFSDSEAHEVSVRMDSVMLYDRVVVQWQGAQGLEIHAREYGADYGEPGHVWRDNPRDMGAVTEYVGGFLTLLGNTGQDTYKVAEVYTFPSGIAEAGRAIEISLEAEVTQYNCGKTITGHALEFMGGKRIHANTITLMAPDCDAVGDFLVLNNLVRDMTVAAR